jgi:hypothetical protein
MAFTHDSTTFDIHYDDTDDNDTAALLAYIAATPALQPHWVYADGVLTTGKVLRNASDWRGKITLHRLNLRFVGSGGFGARNRTARANKIHATYCTIRYEGDSYTSAGFDGVSGQDVDLSFSTFTSLASGLASNQDLVKFVRNERVGATIKMDGASFIQLGNATVSFRLNPNAATIKGLSLENKSESGAFQLALGTENNTKGTFEDLTLRGISSLGNIGGAGSKNATSEIDFIRMTTDVRDFNFPAGGQGGNNYIDCSFDGHALPANFRGRYHYDTALSEVDQYNRFFASYDAKVIDTTLNGIVGVKVVVHRSTNEEQFDVSTASDGTITTQRVLIAEFTGHNVAVTYSDFKIGFLKWGKSIVTGVKALQNGKIEDVQVLIDDGFIVEQNQGVVRARQFVASANDAYEGLISTFMDAYDGVNTVIPVTVEAGDILFFGTRKVILDPGALSVIYLSVTEVVLKVNSATRSLNINVRTEGVYEEGGRPLPSSGGVDASAHSPINTGIVIASNTDLILKFYGVDEVDVSDTLVNARNLGSTVGRLFAGVIAGFRKDASQSTSEHPIYFRTKRSEWASRPQIHFSYTNEGVTSVKSVDLVTSGNSQEITLTQSERIATIEAGVAQLKSEIDFIFSLVSRTASVTSHHKVSTGGDINVIGGSAVPDATADGDILDGYRILKGTKTGDLITADSSGSIEIKIWFKKSDYVDGFWFPSLTQTIPEATLSNAIIKLYGEGEGHSPTEVASEALGAESAGVFSFEAFNYDPLKPVYRDFFFGNANVRSITVAVTGTPNATAGVYKLNANPRVERRGDVVTRTNLQAVNLVQVGGLTTTKAELTSGGGGGGGGGEVLYEERQLKSVNGNLLTFAAKTGEVADTFHNRSILVEKDNRRETYLIQAASVQSGDVTIHVNANRQGLAANDSIKIYDRLDMPSQHKIDTKTAGLTTAETEAAVQAGLLSAPNTTKAGYKLDLTTTYIEDAVKKAMDELSDTVKNTYKLSLSTTQIEDAVKAGLLAAPDTTKAGYKGAGGEAATVDIAAIAAAVVEAVLASAVAKKQDVEDNRQLTDQMFIDQE